MNRVRVCSIGTGRAGMIHARNVSTNISDAELVALLDKDEEAAKKGADELGVEYYTDLDEMIKEENFDAVTIATPTFTHADIAVKVAENGKHIFCEKPLAITLEEADQMEEAVEEAGVRFMIGFMRRYDEGFLEAKEKIDSGEIGEIMSVRSVGRGPGLPPKWAWDPELSNGNLAEVNSHDFDAIRWLTGDEFKSVFARGDNYKTPEVAEEFPSFYDNAVVSFKMESGIIGTVDSTCPAGYGYDARMEILGDEGVIFIGEVARSGVSVCTEKEDFKKPAVSSWQNLFREAYWKEMKHFIDCVRNDKEPRTTLKDGRKAIEVVLASNDSMGKNIETEV
ncbi:MAG: Gfo/Idh/MocA family oxidoreductase [Candidatus Hadarchaeota archaeon]